MTTWTEKTQNTSVFTTKDMSQQPTTEQSLLIGDGFELLIGDGYVLDIQEVADGIVWNDINKT